MGRTRTPKYRLEVDGQRMCWQGRATQARLLAWVRSYAASLKLGGVNQHISLALGHIPYPTRARIVNQYTGEAVAEWQAAAFEVWS